MKIYSPELLIYFINLTSLVNSCFLQRSKAGKSSRKIDLVPSNSSMPSHIENCGTCTEDHGHECYNGGKCCLIEENPVYCRCPPNYYGNFCEQYSLESAGTKTLTLLSSVLGLLLTVFVFIILILLVLHTYKTNKRRKLAQKKRSEVLEKKMMLVQEDMNKMSQTEKMNRLTRFSKLIEATTRAALVTYSGPYVTSPSPFPRKQGLPSISEKSSNNFRRFSEPTILLPKVPLPLLDSIGKTYVTIESYHDEPTFYSM